MKIKYEFADGTVSEVEVEESIGAVIIDSRRREDNLSRKERYHCYSLDAMQYGDKDKFMPYLEESLDWLMEQEEYSSHINKTFARLSEIQQRRMLMLAAGMSMHEIADKEDVDYRAVYDSIKAARKKFLKYF